MSEWTEVQLSELGKIYDGPHATPKKSSSGPYFLNISSLVSGRLELNKSENISEKDFEKWTRRVVPQSGDLLFSYETRLGDAALMPEGIRACLGRRMALIRPKHGAIVPRFLLYLYLGPQFQTLITRNTVHGATVNRIALSTLSSWRVRIAPLWEQQAIAEVLGALDDKIAANTRLAETVDDYLAALLSSNLDSEYEAVPLGSIADVNARTVKAVAGGELRYIDIASVGVGSHDWPEVMPWSEAPSRARRQLGYGDVMWSTVRPNRRSHTLNLSDDARLVASTGLAVLTPREVGFAYLYEVTKLPSFTTYLENVAEGSAYPAVRADRFESASVPLLSAERRNQFESVAAPLRQYVQALRVENRTLAETRDALLPQLMSGRLRVRDVEGIAKVLS